MLNDRVYLRLLNGETKYWSLSTLYEKLKKTARDRSVQRESIWRYEPNNKPGHYLSNVSIGYGKSAIIHLVELKPNVKYLQSLNNPANYHRYIERLQSFINQGCDWLHIDGGNRADSILDWYDNKVKLIKGVYTLSKDTDDGKKVHDGTVTLPKEMNRQDLLDSGANHARLVEQLEDSLFTIETYSDLTEEDRRDLFQNLNDNIDLSVEEKRNCEISDICGIIRDLNDKHKNFFVRYGWLTQGNAERYKFCAWLGYLNNFHTNCHFVDCKSWSPLTLDEDYKSGSPEEKNLPKFIEYFENTFIPMVRIINESKATNITRDIKGNQKVQKIPDKGRFKNLCNHRNALIDMHIILTKIEKEGYVLATDSKRKRRLKDFFNFYKQWVADKVVDGKKYDIGNNEECNWLGLYGSNTGHKLASRLDAIKNEFLPKLIDNGLIITLDNKRTIPFKYRLELLTLQDNKCAITGKYISQTDALDTNITHLDHTEAYINGGETSLSNSQLVYKLANLQKSDK